MMEFEVDLAKQAGSRQVQKKYQRTQMYQEAAQREMARQEQRIQEAVIDEQNKEGPPFILEMAQNEKAIEERTKMLNQIEGRDNYIQIFKNRRNKRKTREKDLQEYHTLYSEDLLVRLTNRGNLQLEEQLHGMREQAERKYKNAIFKGDEQVVMNVSLDHLGNLDQIKA